MFACASFTVRPPQKFPATRTELFHFVAGIPETVAMKKQFKQVNENACRGLQTLSQKLVLTFISLAASDTAKLLACTLGKVNERTVMEDARIDPSRILNRPFKRCQSQPTQLISKRSPLNTSSVL
jgi:hypothetical protein